MQYSTFHALHIGATHVKKALPCQDMCLSRQDGRHSIAVVSDGHGNRRHFRSERGAKLACEIAVERISEFLDLTENLPREEREFKIHDLKFQICLDWRTAIQEDVLDNPWTPEEIEEQRRILSDEQFALFQSGETLAYAYGCTLCAVFASDWGWGAIQVGDGCLTVIEADGNYRWPMPQSTINQGHRTASLCSDHPMEDFRHVVEYGHPAGLMVYTDGIEKSFPSQGKQIIGVLHWVWKNQRFGDENRSEILTQLLGQLTQRSPSGDDVSIAGLIDPNAEDAAPKFNEHLHTRELRTLEAQKEELIATIQYNRRRLSEIDPRNSAYAQISHGLKTWEEDLVKLTKAINAKRELLGLPPVQEPQPEPEPYAEPEIPPVQEEPAVPDIPEEPEAQDDDPDDQYIWENDDVDDSFSEKKNPYIRESEPYRTLYYHKTEPRRESVPRPHKKTFGRLFDVSRKLEEARNELGNILDDLRNLF